VRRLVALRRRSPTLARDHLGQVLGVENDYVILAAFLRDYRSTAHDAPFVPARREEFAALLDTFMLDKAIYELIYELNNRPDWVRIPLRGILSLLREP
jgi:predicted trehalose synthase